MYWVGICDDEKVYRDDICECFKRYCNEKKITDYEIFEYAKGEEISNCTELDILFLDVCLQSVDGIYVKEKLESEKNRTKIIFVSSYSESIWEAFGTNVIGFLKKPIDYRQFCEKTDKAIRRCKEETRNIFYDECGIQRKLYINDIVYIKSTGRYCEIHIAGESKNILSEKSLNHYQDELNKDFVMSHRGYLVNITYVISVEKEVVLESGEHIPLSKRCKTEFVEKFRKSIWGED